MAISHTAVKIIAAFFVLVSLSAIVFAVRQPIVGGDYGSWGTVLNSFLSVSLNDSGELRPIADVYIINASLWNAKAATGSCPSGYVQQNTTSSGVACVALGNLTVASGNFTLNDSSVQCIGGYSLYNTSMTGGLLTGQCVPIPNAGGVSGVPYSNLTNTPNIPNPSGVQIPFVNVTGPVSNIPALPWSNVTGFPGVTLPWTNVTGFPGVTVPWANVTGFPGVTIPWPNVTGFPGVTIPWANVTGFPGVTIPWTNVTNFPGVTVPAGNITAGTFGGTTQYTFPENVNVLSNLTVYNVTILSAKNNGDIVVLFDTQRSWTLRGGSSGPTTSLDLKSEVDDKQFNIMSMVGLIARFNADGDDSGNSPQTVLINGSLTLQDQRDNRTVNIMSFSNSTGSVKAYFSDPNDTMQLNIPIVNGSMIIMRGSPCSAGQVLSTETNGTLKCVTDQTGNGTSTPTTNLPPANITGDFSVWAGLISMAWANVTGFPGVTIPADNVTNGTFTGANYYFTNNATVYGTLSAANITGDTGSPYIILNNSKGSFLGYQNNNFKVGSAFANIMITGSNRLTVTASSFNLSIASKFVNNLTADNVTVDNLSVNNFYGFVDWSRITNPLTSIPLANVTGYNGVPALPWTNVTGFPGVTVPWSNVTGFPGVTVPWSNVTNFPGVTIPWSNVTGFPGVTVPWSNVTNFPGVTVPWANVTGFPGVTIPWTNVTNFPGVTVPWANVTNFPGVTIPASNVTAGTFGTGAFTFNSGSMNVTIQGNNIFINNSVTTYNMTFNGALVQEYYNGTKVRQINTTCNSMWSPGQTQSLIEAC